MTPTNPALATIPPFLPLCVKLLDKTDENRRNVEILRRRLIETLKDCDSYLYDNPHKTVKPKYMRRGDHGM